MVIVEGKLEAFSGYSKQDIRGFRVVEVELSVPDRKGRQPSKIPMGKKFEVTDPLYCDLFDQDYPAIGDYIRIKFSPRSIEGEIVTVCRDGRDRVPAFCPPDPAELDAQGN